MDHWSRRLNQAMEKKGWGVAELARRSGVSVDKLYKYVDGDVDHPRGRTLYDLANALDVSESWLASGVESGSTASPDGQPPGEVAGAKKLPIVSLTLLSSLRHRKDLPALLKEREVMIVPEEYEENAFIVRVTSARMAPKVPEDTLVICQPNAPIQPGDVVFAKSHKTLQAEIGRFRAISTDGKQFELVADNPFFAPIKILSDKDGFLLGRAAGFWQRL
jgi:transcriptional regulator with XRE-family HTH domain